MNEVVHLYDAPLTLSGSPVVAINRALAIAETEGPQAALDAMGEVDRGRRLLADPKMQAIVVQHWDRVMRFGAEYVEVAPTSQVPKPMVMERSEVTDDLVQDMVEVLISFCSRL